ncbi:sulfate adenylyltransferase subunit CysN [Hydrogenimonas cancrithermarum]|uniref:Sulfate adenylyltransferase subunit 1 n=1 Tax=Hydrogenimonas cancrithermarum TaxID=2993563 RepID=A0ABN6WWM7_9BACT|nr:sulfate adenylyltransferase subunit CysN [Hydrogenimonas cancrithermarum]BDY13551.1 sulfate adenylyltransferase subunit 1 [Hydrogenimonas cancrithermarum]
MGREKIADNIEKYLKEHENKQMLRFITCGSVDDGKSTLIGRLLYDSKMIFEDQLAAAKNETKKYGTVGNEEIDFALLIDGLQSEREQGITIDVAYRFFSTDKRKYIIADTPGHEQYTRNMVTGASTADLAVILIDARKGVLTQTRRHSFLVSLLGIRNIVVAINKMDLVGYSREVYDKIVSDYKQMYDQLKFSLPYKNFNQTIDFIPMSALKGDNVVDASSKMAWYEGKPLLEYLDTVEIKTSEFEAFRYPVQYVNRPNLDFRGFAGTIASGTIEEGERIVVYPSKKSTTVKTIVPPLNPETNKDGIETAQKAFAPLAVTLTLDDEIDISRGDLIVKEGEREPYFSDSFEAMMVWMDEEPLKNREYTVKLYAKEANATVSDIMFKRDVNSWEKIATKTLDLNDIARVKIDLSEKVAFDMYEESKRTGAFILIDKITNNTVAAGMIAGVSARRKKERVYTEAERALNAYIREFYPEWGCKAI